MTPSPALAELKRAVDDICDDFAADVGDLRVGDLRVLLKERLDALAAETEESPKVERKVVYSDLDKAWPAKVSLRGEIEGVMSGTMIPWSGEFEVPVGSRLVVETERPVPPPPKPKEPTNEELAVAIERGYYMVDETRKLVARRLREKPSKPEAGG